MDNFKIFVLILAFTLCSCHEQQQLNDLKNYVESVKQQVALPIAKLENMHIIQTAIKLSPNNPFQPTTAMIKNSEKGWIFKDFALHDLELVGTISQGKQHWAILQSPKNLAIIKSGDIFSKHKAKLLVVQSNRVLLNLSTLSAKKNFIVQLGEKINV